MGSDFVFQVDHELVKIARCKKNILVELDQNGDPSLCAVYFSSHNIYFPNEAWAFASRLVDRDFYEWYKVRVPNAGKHIFVRDVYKQWYLMGVNDSINTPQALFEFLKSETQGINVITLGSSAGGYAAMLYGAQLDAKRILSFNGQIELESLVSQGRSQNPVVVDEYTSARRTYLNIVPWIINSTNIYHFSSIHSDWDRQQLGFATKCAMNVIKFRTGHHGVPFLKCALPMILAMGNDELSKFNGKTFSPVTFSIRMAGALAVLKMCIELIKLRFIKLIRS